MTAGINTDTDDLATRFLLDELPEEERVQVENRLLADSEFFERVLSAESALVDQYVQGLLDGDKLTRAKSLFESSSLQREEVRFTKDLIAAVHESNPAEKVQPVSSVIPETYQTAIRNPFRLGWIVPLVLGISLLAWIAYLYSSRRALEDQRLAAERSADETRRKLEEQLHANNELSQQLQSETERRTRAEALIAQMQTGESLRVTSIILAPAATERGGGGPQTVSLRTRSKRVRIQLELDDAGRFNRYSVTISTVGGHRVWENDSLRPDRTKLDTLTLLLPAKLFEYEDYKIELKGQASDSSFVYIDDYLFKVRNK